LEERNHLPTLTTFKRKVIAGKNGGGGKVWKGTIRALTLRRSIARRRIERFANRGITKKELKRVEGKKSLLK